MLQFSTSVNFVSLQHTGHIGSGEVATGFDVSRLLSNSGVETLADHGNKGRFCNTIAAVALVHTSIQSD